MSEELEALEERLHDLSYVLSCKEIDELRNLCYEHSDSWCPLSSFFNDIDLNESETYNEKNQAFKDLWLIALIVLDKKKELEALEIIKKKEVNVYMLLYYFRYSSYEEYTNDFKKINRGDYDFPNLGHKLLTQEEYNLLKEVLCE